MLKENNKKIIKIIYVLFFLVTVLITAGCSLFDNAYKDETFKFKNGKISAIDNSIRGDIVIPSEIKGKAVTHIARDAFRSCNLVRSIVVPNSVKYIQYGAFSGCGSLESITIPFVGTKYEKNGNTVDENPLFGSLFYDNGLGCEKVLQYSSYTPLYGYHTRDYYIPSSLRVVNITNEDSLGYGAFSNCSMITEINFNGKLNKISDIAFLGCKNLSRINSTNDGEFIIPKTITEIGAEAFSGCISVESITLPFSGLSRDKSNNGSHFGRIFGWSKSSGCTEVKQKWYYGGIIGEAEETYYVPSNIRNVYITDATQIGYGAFNNCTMIQSLKINKIPKENVGQKAFLNCVTPEWVK